MSIDGNPLDDEVGGRNPKKLPKHFYLWDFLPPRRGDIVFCHFGHHRGGGVELEMDISSS